MNLKRMKMNYKVIPSVSLSNYLENENENNEQKIVSKLLYSEQSKWKLIKISNLRNLQDEFYILLLFIHQ